MTTNDERLIILIGDDDAANRAPAVRIMESRGYTPKVVVDRMNAVAMIAEHCPDLILLDPSMRVLDGWTTTRRLRRDPATVRFPVLAVTAHSMVGDRERAPAAGCDEVISRPYRPADLPAAVGRLLVGAGPAYGSVAAAGTLS